MNIQMAGIRNIEDAVMCAQCGVNIIGFACWSSPY